MPKFFDKARTLFNFDLKFKNLEGPHSTMAEKALLVQPATTSANCLCWCVILHKGWAQYMGIRKQVVLGILCNCLSHCCY